MKRKEFIKTCSYACLGLTAMGTILQSCAPARNITAALSGENLVIPKSSFVKKDKFLKYVTVRNAQLQYPIYVFRFSEDNYSALYLRCTHQGNELNAYGDRLVCSAHGSEFNNQGQVTNGPATEPLRTFPVQTENQNILISLKKS